MSAIFGTIFSIERKNFEEDWKKYDILLDSQKGILIEYKKCFSAKETAIDEECLSMLDLVLPDNSIDERSLFSDAWDAIKNTVEKEIDFEQKVYSYLQKLAEEEKADKLLENQKIIKTPIVRNGKQATVGYQPDVWKNWK